MALTRLKITLDEYLSFPETNLPCELIDGELFMPPAPFLQHQEIVGKLYLILFTFISQNRLGKLFLAPVDVILDVDRPIVVQPDLVYVSKERASILGKRIQGAPDLVVEVFASEPSRDKTLKLGIYAQYGVREYWLVDPEQKSVEVRRLEKAGFEVLGVYRNEDQINSHVLPGLKFKAHEAFDSFQLQ